MLEIAAGAPAAGWLDVDALTRLRARVELALSSARSTGAPALASISVRTTRPLDPSAVVAGSRAGDEPWFCLEQPARQGWALAAVGMVRALESSGGDRFARTAARWRHLAGAAVADSIEGPAGSGLVAVGGFAFADDGGTSRPWQGFTPASLLVPELSLARAAGACWLTMNLDVTPDDTIEGLELRVQRRLQSLRERPLPMIDPAPIGGYEVVSPMPPSHYEEAVARAVWQIRAGHLQKVVLAREVDVHAPVDHDPAAAIGFLREAFPSCYVFAVGRGDATFLAASPELLVRREGQRASTVALAGSIRRSADPAVDDHLGEQLLHSEKDREENLIVARRIARALRPHSVWVTASPDLSLVRVANIQHLASAIRAQLSSSIDAIELAGILHPTPAVGGEPTEPAMRLIPALEGLDRGWYAGPVGWIDAAGDGEFCVALRCALVRGTVAHCYAGCGIVRDSDPPAELAETEIKLRAMLPVLAG
jgi:salicylate biosynthesis isochorismate synthase